jgi:iron complex outermembrane receptor protein
MHAQGAPVVQEGQPGTVRGRVLDQSGAVIIGAEVRLEPAASGPSRRTVTDDRGEFAFDAVAPGSYLLVAARPGFAPREQGLDVVEGETTVLEAMLASAGITQEVTVTASRLATPVSSIPNTVTLLGRDVLERRTAASDDLASLLEANVPAFGPSMKKLTGRAESFRGRNPLYTINGVPQHTPLRDGERDGHTIDLDFVDRIEVVHGANAIQGIGATGGIVNLVTRSAHPDGRWSQDVKLSVGNHDGFSRDGWSSKLSYLVGKRFGRVDVVAGAAMRKRGLFYDANGDPVGLYPTQGDIMDSSSRGFYVKAGVDFSPTRRLEVAVNDFRLERDGDFRAVAGHRAEGRLASTVSGDPRSQVGDPAENDVTTLSLDYRDRRWLGGELAVQGYVQDYWALFEGGTFPTFALTVGGPAFLDQSAITTDKIGAKITYSVPRTPFWGLVPAVGVDVSRDASSQVLARTNRVWVPETVLEDVAPFVQLQRLLFDRLLVSGGLRFELARLKVGDFTTLPSSRSTFVRGGRPSFTETLPNLGAVLHLRHDLSIYGSLSDGFTMPDAGRVLRAVNTPGLDVESLVDIEPVVARNYETGVDYRLGPARLHAAYYRSVSDRGSLLERTADDVFRVRREATTIDGLDLVADVTLADGWMAGGNYAWIRGRFDSNRDGRRDTDLDGLNIAPNRLNLYVQGQAGARVTGRVQMSTLFDRAFDGLAAPAGRDFSGYTTADLSVAVRTGAGVVRVGLENLFDRQYVIYFSQTEPLGSNDTYFAGPGRSVVLSLERRF